MYKVFIDHKPILFIQTQEFSSDSWGIQSESVDTIDELIPLLKDASIERPFLLYSEDPQGEFQRFFKDYIKIDAAGGIVVRENKYLVIKRHGFWDIPKGKIESGETPQEACVREIIEECGVDALKLSRHLANTYHLMKWDGQPALKKTYWYMLDCYGSDHTQGQIQEGITEVLWMSKDELMAIRSNTYGSINEVLDAFEKL